MRTENLMDFDEIREIRQN